MIKAVGTVFGKTALGFGIMFAAGMILTIALSPIYKNINIFAIQFGFIIASVLMYRWLEKKSRWSFGWKDSKGSGHFLIGAAIAAIIPTLSVIGMLTKDYISLEGNQWQLPVMAFQCLLFLVVAAGEETFFRGYLFGMIKHTWNARAAIVISSILFATLHLINPEAFARPIQFIVLELVNIFLLGLLLAQARFYTGSIWMPIGLHFIINFLQSSVFGFLNGGKAVESFLEVTFINETVWNGSGYGLESSLMLTAALVITIVLMKKWVSRSASKSAPASIY